MASSDSMAATNENESPTTLPTRFRGKRDHAAKRATSIISSQKSETRSRGWLQTHRRGCGYGAMYGTCCKPTSGIDCTGTQGGLQVLGPQTLSWLYPTREDTEPVKYGMESRYMGGVGHTRFIDRSCREIGEIMTLCAEGPLVSMLDKMPGEEGVEERKKWKREEGVKSRPLCDGTSAKVAGALVRIYDDEDSDEPSSQQSEELIASTRAMFDTLLHGHTTIMQSHTAIASEITNSRDLLQTAQALQARVDALEEELAMAAAREHALRQEIRAFRTQSQQTGDADELARRIEKQLALAATIQTVLAETDEASRVQRTATAAELAAARRQFIDLQMQSEQLRERVQKLTRMLEAEQGRMRTAEMKLSDAEQQNKAMTKKVHELEMELQTKSEELELMFKTNEARRHEQRKASEQHDDKRAELQDKVSDLREKVDSLQESREKLKGRNEALQKELRSVNESWDTKWNEENWAKQCAEKQLQEQKRHCKNIESQLADLLKENRELKQVVKQLKDSVGLASTIEKIRQVDVSKEEKTVGFDSVLDRVANVRRAVDELESSKKGKGATTKRR